MALHDHLSEYEKIFQKYMADLKLTEQNLRGVINAHPKASAAEKEHATILLSKIQAAHMPCDFNNVSISQSRGHGTIRKRPFGDAIGFVPNGKKSCQIKMWSGMDQYESDHRKMHT